MRKIKVLLSWMVGMILCLCHAHAGHWTCNPSDFQYDMVAYVGLQIDGAAVTVTQDYEVAAFVGDECRGVALFENIQSTGDGYYSMRIRSNVESGEKVSFRYYDVVQNIEKDIFTTLTFEHQTVVGLPSAPLALEVFNSYLLTFVLDGTVFAADSVVYRSVIFAPEVPEKEGFTFSGWGELAPTMPAGDLTYQATFVLNETQTDGQGLVYRLNESRDAFSVVGYTDRLVADVVVPSELYGLPVSAMQEKALTGAVNLKSIVVPGSINHVGDFVFYGCHSLLVVEWNAVASLAAQCFDEAERYGNMLVFVNDKSLSVEFEGNVVVAGLAESVVLTDGYPFRNPRSFTANHVSYSREFSKKTKVGISGGWEGIILPFDVQTINSEDKGLMAPFGSSSEGLPCWVAEWLGDVSAFSLNPVIQSNRPFIMEVPNSVDYEAEFNIEGKVTFAAEHVTVEATTDVGQVTGNGYSLQGTYEGVVADDYIYALNNEEYMADEETFMPGGVFVAEARDIRPFEAYVHNNQLTRSRYLPIQGGTAQGIDRLLLKNQEDDDVWYTLQGIRLNGKPMQKGIYVRGGKKVLVRVK